MSFEGGLPRSPPPHDTHRTFYKIEDFMKHLNFELDQFYSICEVSVFLSVSDQTVRKIVKEGALEAVQIRGRYRVYGEWIRNYIENHKN